MKSIRAITAVLAAIFVVIATVSAQATDCRYNVPDCAVTSEYNPVCGRNWCDYDNPGRAICAGTEVAWVGRCWWGPPSARITTTTTTTARPPTTRQTQAPGSTTTRRPWRW